MLHRGILFDLERDGRRRSRGLLTRRRRLRQSGRLAVYGSVKARVDLVDDFFDGVVDVVEEWFRVNADPEGNHHKGKKNGVLAEVQVGQRLVHFVSHLPQHDALIEPQEVRGAKDDAKGAPGSPGFADHEGALKDGEFSDETVEEWHAKRTQGDDEIDRGVVGHWGGQPAEFRDEASVAALVENTDDQEECAG